MMESANCENDEILWIQLYTPFHLTMHHRERYPEVTWRRSHAIGLASVGSSENKREHRAAAGRAVTRDLSLALLFKDHIAARRAEKAALGHGL